MNIPTRPALAAGALAFCIVAILNCGGYRYGIGDQAFYIPAVVQHLDPQLFPRDRALLHAQDRFMLYDDVIAGIARTTGVSVPIIFFLAYAAGMLLLFGAIVAIGRAMGFSWWAIVLFAALMTLRHRITQTGANSLEAYFQPRMLAFALGAWAIAAYLRGKDVVAIAVVAAAFATHPTTGLWFGIWIAAALTIADRRWRAPMAVAAAFGAVAAAWAVTLGPLRGHLVQMDALWASALEGKDYIFPSDWTSSFWLVNLAYLVVATTFYLSRQVRGLAVPREAGLVAGAALLVAIFLVSWGLMARGVALALQLQTSRLFWLLDFLAAIYLSWRLSDGMASPRLRQVMVTLFVAAALTRGWYVWRVEHAGNPIVRVGLPADNWNDAMRWISQTPADTYVLADPGHAWKYGSSVRVSGERDVYLEEVKDLALALYSREIAVESLDRIKSLHGFESFDANRLRALAAQHGLDYVVVDRDIDLPLAYRNAQFRVYALQPSAR